MLFGLINFFVFTDIGENAPTPARLAQEPLTVTLLDPQLGSAMASTTIIEFGDFTCPFCRDADIILKELIFLRANQK